MGICCGGSGDGAQKVGLIGGLGKKGKKKPPSPKTQADFRNLLTT